MESSSAEQKFMTRLNEIIDANLHDENFGVSELASELGMNRATLHRKVKAIVNQSVSSFIREARLKRAHKLLQEKAGTVSEIAYMVGFGSVPYFTRSFHKYFGYTPGDVLKGSYSIDETEEQEGKIPVFKKLFHKKSIFLVLPVFILLVFAIGYILIEKHPKPIPKTIAILPFGNQTSNQQSDELNWIVISILDKLERIEGITTIPFPYIKDYPFKGKDPQKIARELNVDYILFCISTQSEENLKFNFNLIKVSSSESVWSNTFDEHLDFETVGADFNLQNKVALTILEELKTRISPEDREQVEKQITENPQALKNYQLAYHILNRPDKNRKDIHTAKSLLEQAIQIDSTFAEAYALLGQVYANNLWFTPVVKLAALYLDSANTNYEKALVYDKKNGRAIEGLWKYYVLTGMNKQAKELEPELPVKIRNYNYYIGQFSRGTVTHPAEQLEAFYKYLELKPEDFITPWWMHHNVFYIYMRMGFPRMAKKHASDENLISWGEPLPNNSYNYSLIQEWNGNYDSALVYIKARYHENPYDVFNYFLLAARNSMRERNYERACIYLDSMEIINKDWLIMLSSDSSRLLYPFGYSYLKTGRTEKGEYLLNRLVKKYKSEIETHWTFANDQYSYLEIALTWSALGNAEKSLEYLQQLADRGGCQLWFILELKNNPMFDAIRGIPEYDDILQKLEDNYNREHERIKQLLISRGIEPA